jgi:hypothetical protein
MQHCFLVCENFSDCILRFQRLRFRFQFCNTVIKNLSISIFLKKVGCHRAQNKEDQYYFTWDDHLSGMAIFYIWDGHFKYLGWLLFTWDGHFSPEDEHYFYLGHPHVYLDWSDSLFFSKTTYFCCLERTFFFLPGTIYYMGEGKFFGLERPFFSPGKTVFFLPVTTTLDDHFFTLDDRFFLA